MQRATAVSVFIVLQFCLALAPVSLLGQGFGIFQGQVIDHFNKPIEGARVTLLHTMVGATTDRNGRFETVVPAGEQELVVWHPNFLADSSRLLLLRKDTVCKIFKLLPDDEFSLGYELVLQNWNTIVALKPDRFVCRYGGWGTPYHTFSGKWEAKGEEIWLDKDMNAAMGSSGFLLRRDGPTWYFVDLDGKAFKHPLQVFWPRTTEIELSP